ncbi:4-coumarate--CoA ligase, photoactive yellow protein activation family [Noviherbaspirillum humi]|uniref:4-coumarate--CoA ligase n=1 Tax=Noviherbaspirillum humi TaxID=1688639 RepID=A0A239C4E8_9BURK|nr:4-coumarate--CoA ligase [Noviherbaspirillum humi]SNS15010.1 4-coumarate--CoA ligase, photoactive yellow protein activation family [Noviherbaspirillum humi]
MPAATTLLPQEQDWWSRDDALRRFVCDLVADELARLRPDGACLPPRPWPEDFSLDRDAGCDSLELVALGAALAEAIHLHESGIEDYLLARRTIGEWTAIAAAGLAHFSARLTFRTSGSTGLPKPCIHPLAHLRQETAELARLLAGARRILSAVPSHHIYGFLFTILLPQQLGGIPVLDVRASSPASLARLCQPGDLIVGHPEFWRALLRALPAMPTGVTGVTSTAPCPAEVADGVSALGLVRLIQIYGSSETAGIGWRSASDASYRLFGHWSRSGEDALERTLPEGGSLHVEVQDQLAWDDEHRFRIEGRRDGAVQVGGINVFPERVRQVLLQHPQVAEAAVRLMQPHEGNRLKAFIVPRGRGSDDAAFRRELEQWMAPRLSAAERPRSLRFGPALARNAMGKPADWPLAVGATAAVEPE